MRVFVFYPMPAVRKCCTKVIIEYLHASTGLRDGADRAATIYAHAPRLRSVLGIIGFNST